MSIEHRIKGFRFIWCDAWFHGFFGYDAILDNGLNGLYIDFLIDGEPYILDLTDKEDEFARILDECNIKEWNNCSYNTDLWVCDGYRWQIIVDFDDEMIVSEGCNGCPEGFYLLMQFFHENGLPRASMDRKKYLKYLKDDIKHTTKRKTDWIMLIPYLKYCADYFIGYE